ncbi:peptide-methionine (R)-S-oxide reductase MsrB [Iamia sp.]|uniref:peptide-methionine (R)-S-oxide reductase MsrB n=1 Tax=Iamia sp. TaxID=2722710 RepID=UPI002BCCDF62|nr:peptide-methionine (R)-S-oxide reductase MsrB [Iamia sp.]HXH56738.1 peptide-methionine (R)-S-oxide reductase MsrB [Iamia sp.]
MTDATTSGGPGSGPLPTPEELKARLTPIQYDVTQNEGTERAFSGEYWDAKDPGTYRCVVCEEPLFRSDVKYESGTGWPSFWEAIDPSKVTLVEDRKLFMRRTEARCARCGAHLGHVFPDGPEPSGERYCMNSASLVLDPDDPSDPPTDT